MNKEGRKPVPYWVKTPTRIKLMKLAQANKIHVGFMLDEIVSEAYDKHLEHENINEGYQP